MRNASIDKEEVVAADVIMGLFLEGAFGDESGLNYIAA